MLIFQDDSAISIIDTIKPVLVQDHYWVLDLDMRDFALKQLKAIESITSPAVDLLIDGTVFTIPVSWNILIIDPETQQLDISEAGNVIGKQFEAFSYGFNMNMSTSHIIEAVEYHSEYESFSPSLAKSHMLSHPIDQDRWVNISPTNSYNKYFRQTMLSGDLI